MIIRAIKSFYSLRKSKKILRHLDRLYRRKAKVLDPQAKEKVLAHLGLLQGAIAKRNAPDASDFARQLQETAHHFMPQSAFEKARHFVFAIGFALVVAVIIRQMWFELYTIPTGSMRPTLKESDFLVVSKTDFGLNVPLTTSHFYFDPSLVQRGSIVVWTGENMDIPDSDTVYFYLFPGKKQFVKRLIGKPGDTLYFYGGKIYGIDREGNELTDLRDPKWFQSLEHIPFIHFDGKVDVSGPQGRGAYTTSTFQQMNIPIAKLVANSLGFVSGEMIDQKGNGLVSHYSDLWGFKNYAMARILTRDQVHQIHPNAEKDLEDGVMYLELTHHPSIREAKVVRDEMNRVRPDLGMSVSILALRGEHLDTIANHMTTCRFDVQNGVAYRYGFKNKDPHYSRFYPKIDGVPNGTYEIQEGKVYQIYPMGIAQPVANDHPLYSKDPLHIQFLYNLGIEFLTQYTPFQNSRIYPSRYAYFRDGDLVLLNAPIVKKEDPALISFFKNEFLKKQRATFAHPYLPFIDYGAPITKEGKIDVDFVRKYGVVVPDKKYLMLGDNHAMSADSRQFGFVPESNLKGSVGFLFSPPGPRFGPLPQPSKRHFAFPSLFVWGSAMTIAFSYALYRRRGKKRGIFFS